MSDYSWPIRMAARLGFVTRDEQAAKQYVDKINSDNPPAAIAAAKDLTPNWDELSRSEQMELVYCAKVVFTADGPDEWRARREEGIRKLELYRHDGPIVDDFTS